MARSYDPACATPKDQVRALVGDTDMTIPADEGLDDGEIAFASARQGDVVAAAIVCCTMLAGKWARLVDVKAADYSESFSQRIQALIGGGISGGASVIEQLRTMQATGAEVVAGGISIAAVAAAELDPDRVPPSFTTDQFDNPRAGSRPNEIPPEQV